MPFLLNLLFPYIYPMKKILLLSLIVSATFIACNNPKADNSAISKNDQETIRQIFDEALTNGQAHQNLRYLCKEIGGRLSGSPQAAEAVSWTKQVMDAMELDRVFLQEVMVPHWVRGKKEKGLILLNNGRQEVSVCALGGSIGTTDVGIQAGVVEVQDFDELAQLGKEQVEGKWVFYNRAMQAQVLNTFRAYGGAVNQRSQGAIEAAKFGAVGAIVRSMTQILDDYPHTGTMHYDEQTPKIPAAAISTMGAEKLSKLLQEESDLQFFLGMNCETRPDTLSHNVVGEIKGSEFPDEVIVVGGHLDSWDLGEGAHDDGAGCMQSIEVLRLFKALGIKPKRTIRAVMFMNEENGLRGGLKYAEIAKEQGENHYAAIESDRGGFTPRGFSIQAEDAVLKRIQQWQPLLAPYGGTQLVKGGGGADIGPLKDQAIALLGFTPDSHRYFDYHHAASDRWEEVNARELHTGAAMIAAMVYLIDKYGLE